MARVLIFNYYYRKLFDLRVNLGPGVYIDTSEEFLEKLIPSFRVHPPYKAK